MAWARRFSGGGAPLCCPTQEVRSQRFYHTPFLPPSVPRPAFPLPSQPLSGSFPASPSTLSRDLAQNIADRVGAILGLRRVVGEGKAAKGDYSKYRKPPLGIERSGTPRPGARLGWQKVPGSPGLRAGVGGGGRLPVSAWGVEGSRAALAARGARLPAGRGEGCGEPGQREGRAARGGPAGSCRGPGGAEGAATAAVWGGAWRRLGAGSTPSVCGLPPASLGAAIPLAGLRDRGRAVAWGVASAARPPSPPPPGSVALALF